MTTFSEPTATLLARISDNVLDEDAWPIRKLTISLLSYVLAVEDVFVPENYKMGGMPAVGWSSKDLQHWASHDPTGEHPEVCKEFSTPTGTYYSGTYRPYMMHKLIRHAFETEGWVMVQPWGPTDSKRVSGYTLHNSNQERLTYFKLGKSRLGGVSQLKPTRTPYLMHPNTVWTGRNLFIEGALPTASRKECV